MSKSPKPESIALKSYRFCTTRKQRQALWRLYCRTFNIPLQPFRFPNHHYREFRKGFANYGDYIGGSWCGMFLGIEKDGYTHS